MTLGQFVDHQWARWANPSWWNLLVVLPWTIGLIFSIHEWRVDRSIASREQTTQGVITVHEPANHNRYGYVFSVNGTTFTGWDRKGELKIGEQVPVYYDSQDPKKNALTDFEELSINSLGPVPIMLSGMVTVFWYIISSRRRQNERNSNQRSSTKA